MKTYFYRYTFCWNISIFNHIIGTCVVFMIINSIMLNYVEQTSSYGSFAVFFENWHFRIYTRFRSHTSQLLQHGKHSNKLYFTRGSFYCFYTFIFVIKIKQYSLQAYNFNRSWMWDWCKYRVSANWEALSITSLVGSFQVIWRIRLRPARARIDFFCSSLFKMPQKL